MGFVLPRFYFLWGNKMAKKRVVKFFQLSNGNKAGRYIVDDRDVRTYRPPRNYDACAELIERHPVTNEPFVRSEWWIFLIPSATPHGLTINDPVLESRLI